LSLLSVVRLQFNTCAYKSRKIRNTQQEILVYAGPRYDSALSDLFKTGNPINRIIISVYVLGSHELKSGKILPYMEKVPKKICLTLRDPVCGIGVYPDKSVY